MADEEETQQQGEKAFGKGEGVVEEKAKRIEEAGK